MKQYIPIFILITFFYNHIIAQTLLNNNQDLIKKEIKFKKFITNSGVSELKDGFQYQEFKGQVDLSPISGVDYVNFNMISTSDLKFYNISRKYIIGYFKDLNDMYVLLTVSLYDPNLVSIVDMCHYDPELMLYNKYGEKISQIELRRDSIDCSFPNFTYRNNEFTRDYIKSDSTDFDPVTAQFLDKKYLQKSHQYFKISFNKMGFEILNTKKTTLKIKSLTNEDIFGEEDDFFKVGYIGEINYPNGGIYKGKFKLGHDCLQKIDDDYGEYKIPNGKIMKGLFCSDSTLCNYPDLYIDNHLINKEISISKKELLTCKGLKVDNPTQKYEIIDFSLYCMINQEFKVFKFYGKEFTLDVKKIFTQIDENSKLEFMCELRGKEEYYRILPTRSIIVK